MTFLNSAYTCSASSVTNTITISNFVNTLISAGTKFTFTVTNVKNSGLFTKPENVLV